MDALEALAISRGFITRPEILDCGYDDRMIRDSRRSGYLVSIGPGLYAFGAAYRNLPADQQHLVRCRAVLHRHNGSVVLSHQSAALAHGAAVWGTDLSLVNITRLNGGRGRQEAGVFHHMGQVDESQIEEVNGLLVVKAPRAIWETACTSSIESGLVTVDSALHQEIVEIDELKERAAHFECWPGSRAGRLTFRLADGRAESPGESRCRYLFWRYGIPEPELQYVVRTADGRVIARTDFGWPTFCHIGEFDGLVKYSGAFGISGTHALTDEKAREDEIRGENLGVSRVVWRQLNPPNAALTAQRIQGDLERSRRLYARNRTTIAL